MQTRQEKKAINRMLKNHGLPTLEAPSGLMEALGRQVMNHEHFRSLLVRCEPNERNNMYESLKPHLRFTPHPLDVYIAQAGQDAEARQLPIWDGEKLSAYNPFEMKTLYKRDIAIEGLTGERLAQAFRYFQQDIPDDLRNLVIYKIHIIEINGKERMQLSAGIFINGKPRRIQ